MDLVIDTLKDSTGSIAFMCLLAVGYGVVVRQDLPGAWARTLLGAMFGLAAMVSMLDPSPVAPGVFVDLRNLPIALAGAFLGLRGAAVAMAMAVVLRLGIGGSGMWAGAAGILIAGGIGLAWNRGTRGRGRRSARAVLVLALLTSSHVLSSLLLPWPTALRVIGATLPVLLPLHVLGVLAAGVLIERERAAHARERRLRLEAHHDALTGLLNRRGFEVALAALPPDAAGALLLLDLDHFKRINDRHGHPAGDAVLRAIGGRLAAALRRGDILARIGGEELAIFLAGQGPEGAGIVARRLCEAVRAAPFTLPDGTVVPVTVSLGGAGGPASAFPALLAQADAALYDAKAAGRDRWHFADAPAEPASAEAASGPQSEAPSDPATPAAPRRRWAGVAA
ncbi:diguanylate cyclase [Rubellimicrobium aerolatum]|uniref:diguanylate cyclase n=1 Tax=Rubellimicrobium aerolatum TaxID=490979 RepID=A0ABW0SD06_9RHOB|nr:diguanylate cyclase [Rubellimicrobium aerolatum]MBP1806585.1 diguanylate cyclase [Rubellimicrobium aerolatum]